MKASSSPDVVDLMRAANRLRFDQPREAQQLYAKAIEGCRKARLRRELIKALKGLGQIERDLNNGDMALPLYEEALALCRQEGDELLLAHTVRHVGDVHQNAGRNDLATTCYEEALALYRANKETPALDLANAVRPFALLKQNAGEIEEAKLLWTEARDLYARCKVPQGVAECSRRINQMDSREVTM